MGVQNVVILGNDVGANFVLLAGEDVPARFPGVCDRVDGVDHGVDEIGFWTVAVGEER